MMICAVIILAQAATKWVSVLSNGRAVQPVEG
jgi:hypothetical protein